MKVPRDLAEKLDKRAKAKDKMKSWAAEAREILQAAADSEDTQDMTEATSKARELAETGGC